MSAETILGALLIVAGAPTEDEWLNAMSKPQAIAPHVSRAITALEKKDTAAARESLAAGAESLRRLYGSPAARIAEEIAATGIFKIEAQTPFPRLTEEAVVHRHGTVSVDAKNGDTPLEPLDFVELETLIAPLREKLDPEVVARVESAEIKYDTGDRVGAVADLKIAYARLVDDLALGPIEHAYARVIAARAELDAGNARAALRLLRGVAAELEVLLIAAPLAAVRYQVRDAAVCAEAQSWDCAGVLVAKANERVEAVLGTRALKKSELAKLRAISAQLDAVQTRLEAGKPASPRELRKIATRAQGIEPAG